MAKSRKYLDLFSRFADTGPALKLLTEALGDYGDQYDPFFIQDKVVEHLKLESSLRSFSKKKLDDIGNDSRRVEYWSDAETGKSHFLQKLFRTPEVSPSWDGLPDLDHHEVVYNLISTHLGIPTNDAHRHGLKLVVAPGSPSYIGLLRSDVLEMNAVSNFLSVKLQKVPYPEIYECFRIGVSAGSDPKPTFTVVGVWIMNRLHDHESIGAVIQAEGKPFDAILV